MRSLVVAVVVALGLTLGSEPSHALRDCGGLFECLFGDIGVGSSSTRRIVSFSASRYRPGSIVIRTPERALYYVLPGGKAIRYSVGVGREGFQWGGVSRIARKAEWPGWTPPAEMIRREARNGVKLPRYMPGGPNNPLGARALYISGTLYRIHGTNAAHTIGSAMSSGCIRMMNHDVIDLYERVKLGARVYVYQ